MNVVLVNPPIRLPRVFAHYPMFSTIGLLTNAAWLRARGHAVRVVDGLTLTEPLNIRPDGGDFRHVGAEVDDLARAVRSAVDDLGSERSERVVAVVVALTMFSEMNRPRETLVPATAAALRRLLPGASIGLADFHVGGMNYFPYEPRRALAAVPEADWVVVGEGEPTLPPLLDRLAEGRCPEGLARVAVRRPGGEVVYDDREPTPVADLDDLPPPAFDLLDMDRYFAVQADAIRAELVHEYHVVERQLPLMTSRGCPYRCSFCTNQVLGLPWRAHSVEYLARVVRDLGERYRVDRFLFLDDNININAKRFRDLVELLAKERVAWDAVNGYRADRLDREMVRAIKAAGNTKITVSAESADPEILRDVIGKKLKLSSIVNLARTCDEERIPLQIHYIVGVPGETKAQINKTLEFATMLFEQHGAWPLVQHAIPFPGTRLFRECETNGWFVAPPFEIPGDVLEVRSIIRTPDFEPEEVVRMKHNAQRLHAATQALVYLEIEMECDARCLACHCAPSAGEGAPQVAARPTREALSAALDRALFLGGRDLFLGGGEPTLRPDLADFIREARDRGFARVALVTNASGLSDEARGSAILDAGVDRLVLDLLGPDASAHDACAGASGAFARSLDGVARARARGVAIEVVIPILRRNLRLLPATARLARRLGACAVHLQVPPPDGRAAAAGQIVVWDEARPWIHMALGQGRQRFVTVQGAPPCLMPEAPGAATPSPPWIVRRQRRLKMKHPACLECVDYVLCGGFFASEHEARYGMLAARGLADAEPAAAAPAARTVGP